MKKGHPRHNSLMRQLTVDSLYRLFMNANTDFASFGFSGSFIVSIDCLCQSAIDLELLPTADPKKTTVLPI